MSPRLLSLATTVPDFVIDRGVAAAVARQVFADEAERLATVFFNSGIDRRRSCVPPEWYLDEHGWAERARLYVQHAEELACRATRDCLNQAGLKPDAVDAIIAVSTSGVCTPSLDALVMERLGLRRNVVRLPVFGLGCAGGVLGLGRAAALATAMPGAKILLVVVELCGLTFRSNDASKSNQIATALFGDGAAAAIISTKGDGPAISAWGEHTWPNSLDVMGWHIEDDGFGVLFSRDIPTLVRRDFRPALDDWLKANRIPFDSIASFLCHPGGAKVVAALEEALELVPGTLEHERAVLRDFGNMSAATLLFVVERALKNPPFPERALSVAFGPGFTAGFLLWDSR